MIEHVMPHSHSHNWSAHKQKLGKAAFGSLVLLAITIALVVIIRLVLDPIATHETRKAFSQLDGYKGDFERVHVTLFGPGYDITRVKLVQLPERRKGDPGTKEGSGEPVGQDKDLRREPLLYVERVHVGVNWRELLHLRVVAAVRLDKPKIIVMPEKKRTAEKTTPETPDLSVQLQQLTALKVARVEVLGGEILFRANVEDHAAEMWVHRLELVAENLATRNDLAQGRPATVSAHGTVGHTGDLTLFVSADPLASPLSFAGQMSVTGLSATELYEFIEPKTKMEASKGTIDVFAEFVSKKGMLTGGVKPVLKNIEIRPTDSGVWDRLKAWLADKSVEIASDRVPGRNAVATTVPIKGTLTRPDIQLWPAVLGVIRNAFVQGLASGFANVPPATSDKKEGTLTQAKNALTKDEGPPKAQPADKADKK